MTHDSSVNYRMRGNGDDNIEDETNVDDESEIKSDDIFRLIDLYFNQPGILYNHQISSFDKFLDEDIPNILMKDDNIFYEKITREKKYRHRFSFSNISIRQPMIENQDEHMFPVRIEMKVEARPVAP